MNNGVANEAIRCFRRLLTAFVGRVRAANPRLTVHLEHVQPRNLGELPTHDVDLFLSTGGPGSPHDGWDERWCTGYRTFLDWMMDAAVRRPEPYRQVGAVRVPVLPVGQVAGRVAGRLPVPGPLAQLPE